MLRIIITGAESFVGNNYFKFSRYTDIGEISLIDKTPKEIDLKNVEVIIHLAAIVHQSRKIPEVEYFRVNRDLTIEVAKVAKQSHVRQFIFLSTVKVYGEFNPESGPWTESSPCHPEDPYGKSKFEAELELKKLENNDFTVSIIRTPLVYGKGVRANMLSIIKLVDYLPILPFGGVNNKRSFTYVKNLVGFIDRIIEKRASGVFIAMDSEPLSTTQLVKLIADFLDKKRILLNLPRFFINIGKRILPKIFDRLYGSFEMENSRTLEMLDFKPKYPTQEGIKEMVTDYLRNKK